MKKPRIVSFDVGNTLLRLTLLRLGSQGFCPSLPLRRARRWAAAKELAGQDANFEPLKALKLEDPEAQKNQAARANLSQNAALT